MIYHYTNQYTEPMPTFCGRTVLQLLTLPVISVLKFRFNIFLFEITVPVISVFQMIVPVISVFQIIVPVISVFQVIVPVISVFQKIVPVMFVFQIIVPQRARNDWNADDT